MARSGSDRQRPAAHRRLEHPVEPGKVGDDQRRAVQAGQHRLRDGRRRRHRNARLYWTTPQATQQVIPPGNLSIGGTVSCGADDNFHLQSKTGSFKPAPDSRPTPTKAPRSTAAAPVTPSRTNPSRRRLRQPRRLRQHAPGLRQSSRTTSSSPTPTAANASRKRPPSTSAGAPTPSPATLRSNTPLPGRNGTLQDPLSRRTNDGSTRGSISPRSSPLPTNTSSASRRSRAPPSPTRPTRLQRHPADRRVLRQRRLDDRRRVHDRRRATTPTTA